MKIAGYPILGWKVHRERSIIKKSTVSWSVPEVEGDAPCARAGHSATRLRECIVIFGGAADGGALNDTHILSTPSILELPFTPPESDGEIDAVWPREKTALSWSCPEVTGEPPSARAYHTAVGRISHVEGGVDQLLIFGGAGKAGRLGDLFILTVPGYEWSKPRIEGVPPYPTLLAYCRVVITARHAADRVRYAHMRWN